jgi:phosphatidylglycerol:prolipoprotein diacylglycerol transferase
MRQVLFTIPIHFSWFPDGIPIYGYGAMLFVAFVACTWMLSRFAWRANISRERIQDLSIWVFLLGILGARTVYMIQYWGDGVYSIWDFYKIWQGGIVFYGSAIGGWIGFLAGRAWYRYWDNHELVRTNSFPWRTIRARTVAENAASEKYEMSTWKLADVVAPAVCVGLAIGRLGCFLNGCCFGHVCTADTAFCTGFPTLTTPARAELVVKNGFQTTAGFTVEERFQEQTASERLPAVVGGVESGSPAAAAGLKPGDRIEEIAAIKPSLGSEETIRQPVQDIAQLKSILSNWPRGVATMELTVRRSGEAQPLHFRFTPTTLPLYPTQLFESISMILLFFVLLTFFPYRQYYGQVFVVLMVGYAFHRFFNETLRNDTDPVLWNLTISQVISVLVLISAILLHFFLRRRSPLAAPAQPAAVPIQASVAVGAEPALPG